MKHLYHSLFIVMACMLSACEIAPNAPVPAPKPITSEMKITVDGASDFGREYGMGKRCNLKEAEQYSALFQQSLKDRLGANYTALSMARRNFAAAAKTEQAKTAPIDCGTVASNMGTLIAGFQRKND